MRVYDVGAGRAAPPGSRYHCITVTLYCAEGVWAAQVHDAGDGRAAPRGAAAGAGAAARR
eukprot:2396688-Pyramimonas_sp.AAC.2